MTTTEYLANAPADKHTAWMHGILSHIKFSPAYAEATLEVTFNRVKGEALDTFAVFTLADGTVTRLSSGHGKGDLNGNLTPWPEARKAFKALVAPAEEVKAPAPKAKEEKPVKEAAAPAKPKAKRARKAKAPKAVAAEEVAPEVVQAAIEKVFEDAKDVPFMPDPEDVSDLDA